MSASARAVSASVSRSVVLRRSCFKRRFWISTTRNGQFKQIDDLMILREKWPGVCLLVHSHLFVSFSDAQPGTPSRIETAKKLFECPFEIIGDRCYLRVSVLGGIQNALNCIVPQAIKRQSAVQRLRQTW
jgi:hypothetical protein